MTTDPTPAQKIAELAKGIDFAMLTTVGTLLTWMPPLVGMARDAHNPPGSNTGIT